MRLTILVLTTFLWCAAFGTTQGADDPRGKAMDWPTWRGPEMNGVSREKNLPAKWSPDGENVLWKNEELGGRSTPIVMNGRLYTLVRHKPATEEEAEKVICVDAKTGKTIWENVFNVFSSDVPDTRVGWSSVVGDPATGHVFALGVAGYFQCIDGETGKTLWAKSLSEEYGMLTTYGGRTNFPVVFENLAIISGVLINWGEYAQPAHRILAFDKRNGQLVWLQTTKLRPEDTTYSTPVLGVVGGQWQLVLASGDGSVYGFQPRTGKEIWRYDVSIRGINTSPVIVGSTVIGGHSEENLDDTRMGALFAIDASKTGDVTKSGELWRNKEQSIGKCSPLVIGDRVYAIDDGGVFFVVELKTGKLVAKSKIGTMGRASPVYGDGKIYCVDATGRWMTFELDEAKGVKKVHQMRLDQEVNASPIISHGRLYVTTDTALYCIGDESAEPSADPLPEIPAEAKASESPEVAQALLVPAESLLKPGQAQPFQTLLYNKNGQFLRAAKFDEAKYELQGIGEVLGDTKFELKGVGEVREVPKFVSTEDAGFGAAIVTATVGEAKARARVRVIPEAPWNLEFSDGVVPLTGIGMRYRHVGLDEDLLNELRKEDPLAAKCYIFLTTSFTNLERSQLKIDDSTPAQAWTNFRRYLDLLDELTSQELAQEKLDPALKRLQDAKVIKSFKWAGTPETGAQLLVAQGERKIEGNGVMCKITTIPKGTRSQGWLGHPSMKNYDIQADVYALKAETSAGADANSKLPDIGLLNQRYRMELMGAGQQIKLYSWYPHDQKYHAVDFQWEPEVWYTMKFRVTVQKEEGEDVALLEGKIWKRGEEEPKEWTTSWKDPTPNDSGSPGLSGNAKDTEVLFDNLKVTPRD